MDLCPSCGEFAESLDEVTGFCAGCTDEVKNKNKNGPLTRIEYLKVERYLAVNADELEFHMGYGLSFWQALDEVAAAKHSRPTCIVCGHTIKQGRRTSIFCHKTPACRRYSRRYTYLYRERKPRLSKSEALALIFKELDG